MRFHCANGSGGTAHLRTLEGTLAESVWKERIRNAFFGLFLSVLFWVFFYQKHFTV